MYPKSIKKTIVMMFVLSAILCSLWANATEYDERDSNLEVIAVSSGEQPVRPALQPQSAERNDDNANALSVIDVTDAEIDCGD